MVRLPFDLIEIQGLSKKELKKVLARLGLLGINTSLTKYHNVSKDAEYLYIDGYSSFWGQKQGVGDFTITYEDFLKIPVTHKSTGIGRDSACKILRSNEWTRFTQARDKQGVRVNPTDPNAVSYCMIGACRKLFNLKSNQRNSAKYIKAIKKLAKTICESDKEYGKCVTIYNINPVRTISSWNDQLCESKEQAVKIMKKAGV